MYIYEHADWPNFIWNSDLLLPLLAEARNLQGKLTGKMESLGFELRNESSFHNLSMDVLKSSEIEGEILNTEQVRSSLARHLGITIDNPVYSDRNVDGVVEMILDATQNYSDELTFERLFGWHSALFPSGRSGLYQIRVGDWRDDHKGPMQVISGSMGKERVHFQAPESKTLPFEMNRFTKWFNEKDNIDLVLKAGIAHFWFVTIHPFDDGNGRIARAISDMLLSRSDNCSQRFYSVSSQIRIERNGYYNILENSQKGTIDITSWLSWFVNCFINAIKSTDKTLNDVLFKNTFWNKNGQFVNNERQRLIINKLLGEFKGKLTSTKWAKITKCSQDTALRDINDLVKKNILVKDDAGGRSTSYRLNRDI